jgi:hypothetical protein
MRVAALEGRLRAAPGGEESSLEARVSALETRLGVLEAGLEACLAKLEHASRARVENAL